MSYFAATPDAFSAVSSELTSIGSAIRQAHVAAATWTTQVEFAAGDEVSAAIAELFGGYAQQYQALAAQAAAFHDQFTRTMATSAASYLGTEAANAQVLERAMGAPAAAVNGSIAAATGRPLIGNGANGTTGSQGTAGGAGGWLYGSGGSGGNSTASGAIGGAGGSAAWWLRWASLLFRPVFS